MNLLMTKGLILTMMVFSLEFPSNSCRQFFSQKPPSYTVSLKSEMLTSDPKEITGSLKLQPIPIELPSSVYPNLELTANTAYNLENGKSVFLDRVQVDFVSTKNKTKFPSDIGMQLVYDDQVIELPNLTYDAHADSSKPLIVSIITDTGKALEDENPKLRIAMPTSTLKKILQAESVKLQSSFLSFQFNNQQLMGLRAFAGSIIFQEKNDH